MGAITPTKVATLSSPGGELVLKVFTVPLASASDTVDLTTHFDSILAMFCIVNAGQDADLVTAHCTESGETVTIATLNAAGAAATNWDSIAAKLFVIGTAYPQ